MTLLGLAVIRSITQEERMAGQNYSRSLSFQATESALRTVEELIETKKPTPAAGAACAAGEWAHELRRAACHSHPPVE